MNLFWNLDRNVFKFLIDVMEGALRHREREKNNRIGMRQGKKLEKEKREQNNELE